MKWKKKKINKYEFLNIILDKGFDFNIKDNKDMLPIDYAYLKKDKEAINILIKRYMNSGLPVPENLFNNS